MDQRAFSVAMFLLGLGVLLLSGGTLYFDLTPADDWLAFGMLAFGLILSLCSYFMLGSGDLAGTAGAQGRVYGGILFLYGLTTLILSLVAIFGGLSANPLRPALMAVSSLGICLLSAFFMSSSD